MEFSYIVDSSVWVSLFDNDDSMHSKALDIQHIIEKATTIPDFILTETATVLKIKKNLKLAESFIDFIKENSEAEAISFFDEYQDDFSKEFVKPENVKLSYADASLLALHKTKKYKVVTFDKNLLKQLEKVS